MIRRAWIGVGLVGVLATIGCRAATRVSEVPRVDLSLEQGNRGYLAGTAPPAGELKTTRQMVDTTVEVPSFYTPKRGTRSAVDMSGFGEAAGASAVEAAAAPGTQVYDVYVVQKGDSLWSIAAKREIYGKATRWRELFDANRDQLTGPNRLRPGMTLKIPRSGAGGPTTTYGEEEEGTSFKK